MSMTSTQALTCVTYLSLGEFSVAAGVCLGSTSKSSSGCKSLSLCSSAATWFSSRELWCSSASRYPGGYCRFVEGSWIIHAKPRLSYCPTGEDAIDNQNSPLPVLRQLVQDGFRPSHCLSTTSSSDIKASNIASYEASTMILQNRNGTACMLPEQAVAIA